MKRLPAHILCICSIPLSLLVACGGGSAPTDAELTRTIEARIAQAESQIEVLAGSLPTPDFDVTAGAMTANAQAGENLEATSRSIQTQSANETPAAFPTGAADTGGGPGSASGGSTGGDGAGPGSYGAADEHDTIIQGTVSIGAPVTGEIASAFDAHNWTFQGSDGQAILIRVAPAAQGDFEIVLFDPAGVRLAEVDGGGDGVTEQISKTLAANGVFTIRIRAWRIDQYTLTVTNQ